MNEPTTQPNPEQVRKAAAAIVAPDPETAAILEKKTRGEKLSPREHGILGALKAKALRMVGMGDSPGEQTTPRPRDAINLASVATAQAPGSGLPAVPPDPGLCQRVTGAVLARVEAIARAKLLRAAREAYPNAQPETLRRFNAAASLSPADKALMIELSPDVLRELGLDPKRYCLAVFFGTLSMWGIDMWLAIDDLKQEAREREKREAPEKTLEAVRGLSESAAKPMEKPA